ncbi:putative MFS family arabinose efflux permease [Kluyvera sp. 1366]
MTDLASPAHVAQAGNVPTGETKWIRSAADVSGLVNNSNESRSNARIVIAIALGGVFLDAYDLGALAFGIKDVTREFQLTPAGTGMVASAITFGAIVGALIGGYLTDKIGRYRVFMADMFFFVVAALACAFAPNEYVLAGARFVMGLGVGIDLPVAMAFLAEFSKRAGKAIRPPAWRCGVRHGTRRSVFPTCWSCCCMRCCPKATPIGCGV